MVDLWQRGFKKVSATNVIARGGAQDKDKNYERVTPVPRPSDDPAWQNPQPRHGQNADYYGTGNGTTSPFSSAAQVPGPYWTPHDSNQSWNSSYTDTQQQSSPSSPVQGMYLPSQMYPQSQQRPTNHLTHDTWQNEGYAQSASSGNSQYQQPPPHMTSSSPPQFQPHRGASMDDSPQSHAFHPQPLHRAQTVPAHVQTVPFPNSWAHAPASHHDCEQHRHQWTNQCEICMPQN